MRKERKIINTNIRLNLCDEQDRHLKDYAMNLGLITPPQNVTEALFLQNVFSEEEDLS